MSNLFSSAAVRRRHSAASGVCWKENSLLAGADDYLAKPFDIDQLLERVGSHLLSTVLAS